MHNDFQARLAVRFPRTVVMGITGNWAFAAGTVLLALRRHNPALNADIIVFCDGALPAEDARILHDLGAQLVPFTPVDAELTEEALRVFSPLSLAKFHCFDLLRHYESVVWLDSDILVQDSLEDLFACGPLGLALEDPEFSDPAGAKPAQINLHGPVQGFDSSANNLNSGVIVFRNDLPEPENLRQMCIDFVCQHGTLLRYPDQAAFNALVQMLLRQNPQCVQLLPQQFNAHPRNPVATYAPIVHAFGAYKLWNDGLTATCFPEWQRDYARWLRLGGSPYAGTVENADFLEGGAFSLLTGLCGTIEKAQVAIADMQQKLEVETRIRARLEAVVSRLG